MQTSLTDQNGKLLNLLGENISIRFQVIVIVDHIIVMRCDGEVKLACRCMLPVLAGAFSHESERKLKCIFAGKTLCGVGSVSGHKVRS